MLKGFALNYYFANISYLDRPPNRPPANRKKKGLRPNPGDDKEDDRLYDKKVKFGRLEEMLISIRGILLFGEIYATAHATAHATAPFLGL